MQGLFDSTEINGLQLANRIVRSATWEGMCDEKGCPTEKLYQCYVDLARGGVGLIITGYTYVSPEGKQLPGKMGLYTDSFADAYRRMADSVHQAGGKICVQLVHAGGQTSSKVAGRQPLAPSAIEAAQFDEKPAAMTQADITRVVEDFGKAAGRAKAYGFDAVQLHAAHGYLINQFLSPHTNRRTDEYGGGISARCQFMVEILKMVRQSVGSDFPVLVKLNGADNIDGGLTAEEAIYAARQLNELGVDAIEVSGGTPASGPESPVRTKIDAPEKEAYNLNQAMAIKKAVDCPVISVGGFRSYPVAEQAVANKGMDYISMARPFIREPALVRRWQKGDTRPARCISCNGCFEPGIKEGGIYCVVEKKEGGNRQ